MPQTQDQQQKIPVELRSQGDSGHVYHGTIESFDNHIDTGSGTIRARARFANDDGALVPGMFVSVRMGGGTLEQCAAGAGNAPSATTRASALSSSSARTTRRNIAKSRWAPTVDGERVVTSGLKSGDRVIVDGVQTSGARARRSRRSRAASRPPAN